MKNILLDPTRLLDFHHPEIEALVAARGWRALPERERIGAIYDFVRNDIAFGYNLSDDLPASRAGRRHPTMDESQCGTNPQRCSLICALTIL